MKTAEEIYDELHPTSCATSSVATNRRTEDVALISSALLDAAKWGMRRAAAIKTIPSITDRFTEDYNRGGNRVREAILTAAEQLTEKDLAQ